jgi:ATP dependent DNA ligase domain
MSQRTLPAGFIAPCLPTKTNKLPSGSEWLHEIKHDGFRIIARKSDGRVRLYSRPGNDFTRRFPLIVDAIARLRSRSCIIDGEAVACDDNGVASFDLVRHHRANESIFLYAFDLIELNGDDLRRDPLEVRKATLASIVANACRLITLDPKEARFSGQGSPGHPWGQAVPGRDRAGGSPGKPPLRYLCHVRDSSTGCDARAQNRMQRCGFGVKVRQEPSSVSLCQP